ncbi:hypothetical protein Taro_004964 [Colocasia esculenta]|uniref:Uncharacterized protein n=1 Tax=Colocasia esculenta TaxID=4460 RepID=A0A843TRP0_COLES|nr:hypothetical protein [Colocasia esculenta]
MMASPSATEALNQTPFSTEKPLFFRFLDLIAWPIFSTTAPERSTPKCLKILISNIDFFIATELCLHKGKPLLLLRSEKLGAVATQTAGDDWSGHGFSSLKASSKLSESESLHESKEESEVTLSSVFAMKAKLASSSSLQELDSLSESLLSSFTTEGKQHPGYHQIFLHNRRETTPWIPPGLPSHKKGKHKQEKEIKPLDQAFDKQGSEATRTESKDLNKAHSQNYTGSHKIFTN